MHHVWGFGGDIGAMGIVGWVVMALFWGLVVVALVAAIRWLIRAGDRGGAAPAVPPAVRPDDPLEILRQRYARGEIDDEEFERRRKTLTGG